MSKGKIQFCVSPKGWRYGMPIDWDATLHCGLNDPMTRKQGERLETLCTLSTGPQPIDVMRCVVDVVERVNCRECLELIHA